MPESATASQLPLLGSLDAWRNACHRPALLICNGPSSALVDPARLPADAVVVRVNAFMFEKGYPFGTRVDGVFWAVARRWLQVAYRVAMAEDLYQFGTFFNPNAIERETVYALRDEAQNLAATLQPRLSHFDVLRADPIMNEWFTPRAFRKRKGLPTQGLQALATLLCLGYRDIHVAGMDFYQSAGARYAYPYPDFIQAMTAPVHLTPSYEGQHHGIELDLAFFLELQSAFPDAQIRTLVPESFLGRLVPTSPRHDARGQAEQPPKDIDRFNTALRASLLRRFEGADGLCGEVICRHGGRPLIWAWDPARPGRRQLLDVFVDGRKVSTLRADRYHGDLDLACIGDASHSVEADLLAIAGSHEGQVVEVRDQVSGQLLRNGKLHRFSALRANRKDLAETLLLGPAPLSEEAVDRLDARAPGDRILRLVKSPFNAVPAVGIASMRAELAALLGPALAETLPEQVRLELAAILAAPVLWPDRGVRIGGLVSLTTELATLQRAAAAAPEAFAHLLGGFRRGLIATLDTDHAVALASIEASMRPVIVCLERIGDMTNAAAASASPSHALVESLPNAKALDVGLWEIGIAERLSLRSRQSSILLDGRTALAAPIGMLAALTKEASVAGRRLVVHLESLPPSHILPNRGAAQTARLRLLAEAKACFALRSNDVLLRLREMLDVEPEAKLMPPPPRWTLSQAEARERVRCAVLVHAISAEFLQSLNTAIWEAPAALASRIEIDLIPDGLLGIASNGVPEGQGCRSGVGCPTPEALASYDVVLLASEGVGLPLGARFLLAASRPCLALTGTAGSMLLPSEAVLSSLAEFVDRLATLADGRAIPAAQPAPAADDLRQTLAELTRLLYPTGAPLPPVDLMLGALPAPRRQVAVPEIDAVAVWVNAPEAFTGALRLILHNRGSTWLPAHSALQARLHLRGVDDMAPLALTVPHDLAPGETLSMSAQLPPSAENAVAVLELQTIDGSMVVRRDLGSVPKGSQP